MLKQPINRRSFLKKAGATGLLIAGAAAIPGCSSATEKVSWKEEADVVIIGSGFAGLAAALEAVQAGVTVKIIEKMPTAGGNSIINGGDFAAAGTKMQAEANIDDSPEVMLQDMLRAGLSLNHVEKARIVAEKSNETFEWSQNYLGVKYAKVNFHGGHAVPRTHTTINGTGADIVKAMLTKLQEKGIKVETGRKLVRLIQNDEGRITGVEVKDNYRFGDEGSGALLHIKAKQAVILASGGFSQDVQMRMIHDPRLTDKYSSTNQPGATGEVLREAMKIGAMDVQMDWIQTGPWASPDEKGFGYVPQFCERLVGYSPMVNPKTGKRFISETGNRKERADAIMAIGIPAVIFGDAYIVKRQVLPSILDGGLKNGAIKQFAALEELAKAYEIPWQDFTAQINRWNSMVTKGEDDDFKCKILDGAKPVGEGPYYAARLWPKVHHCMGGLVTNNKGQVVNQDFEIIPGLYAAGELSGGTHGAVRLGGCAVVDCLTYGRIVGQEAAQEQAWS